MSSFLARRPLRTLEAISGAAEYLKEISELDRRFGSSCDEAQLVYLLQQASIRLGADCSFFVSCMSEGGSFETCRILVACDPLWCLGYERDACYADDPWLAYAVRHTEPLRASEFSCLSDRQRAVVGLAESFGFRSVVVVPAPTAGFLRSGMLVLGSELEGYFEGDGYPALKVLGRSLAMSLHECYIALIARELRATSRLSDEDLRLLAYERQGLGTKSIARLSGVSCEAIDTRFRRLNAKLNAPNRTAAARLVEEYGLI